VKCEISPIIEGSYSREVMLCDLAKNTEHIKDSMCTDVLFPSPLTGKNGEKTSVHRLIKD